MTKIVIYTADSCKYCGLAKEVLSRRGIKFEEVRLSYDDDAAWDALTLRSGMKTVPQIFVGDRLIGGFSDLQRLDSEDALASLSG
jgi:glutaredoxin 3